MSPMSRVLYSKKYTMKNIVGSQYVISMEIPSLGIAMGTKSSKNRTLIHVTIVGIKVLWYLH